MMKICFKLIFKWFEQCLSQENYVRSDEKLDTKIYISGQDGENETPVLVENLFDDFCFVIMFVNVLKVIFFCQFFNRTLEI